MRIAILADPIDSQYAGIHIFTKEMVKALIRYDKQNEYILIRQKRSDDFTGIRQYIVPNYPHILAYQSLRLFVMIPQLLRRLKVDAVVEPGQFGPFNLPKNVKRITVIHDLTPILFPHLHRYHSQLLQRIFFKRILKAADLIISNSDNTSNDIYKHYSFTKGKVKRIYLGKDDHFREIEKADIISRYNNIEENYILSVGTIEPRKNLLSLLNAFEVFRNKKEEIYKLIIVGKKGWKTDSFFSALEKHPYKKDINILGYVSRNELPLLYAKASAFIYPSIYEGFGLPVLEAMACGTPCLVSGSSSMPEVGGSAAEYFNPMDSEALSSLMLSIIGNEQKQREMGRRSLEQAEKFSWKKYAEEFITAIKTMS